ncbi:unnamed protein product, partial [Vitis vinifera]|uniref:Uncharacterized protein n=1 Tax=Vitis vinifera TaxID=29760 RepID=D7TYQ6_VITVI
MWVSCFFRKYASQISLPPNDLLHYLLHLYRTEITYKIMVFPKPMSCVKLVIDLVVCNPVAISKVTKTRNTTS